MLMIPHVFSRQPCQPVNQCKKVSRSQDHAGFMPRVIQKRSGSPASSHHLCNCTGELCVHPVHLFTKLGTCPLTKSRGFPTPCIDENLRVPGTLRKEHLKFAGGIDAYGVWGYVPLQMWCNSCNWCNWCNDGW